MDKQCSSCGGFCKKSGCERQNVQPEHEPVAWETFALKFANGKGLSYEKPTNLPKYLGCRPLYTTPPQRTWVGLTGFEQKELMAMSARDAVFATEAKLRSKNT